MRRRSVFFVGNTVSQFELLKVQTNVGLDYRGFAASLSSFVGYLSTLSMSGLYSARWCDDKCIFIVCILLCVMRKLYNGTVYTTIFLKETN
jgi:hypothetical protein